MGKKIVIHSSTLRNEKMNIRGVDLQFDGEGKCDNVSFEIAKLIVPMHGFKVDGLDEDQRDEAEEHLKNVNKGRAVAVKNGKVRQPGPGTVAKESKRAFVTNAGGHEPGEPPVTNAGEKLPSSEEESPKKPKINGKKKRVEA